MTTVPDVGAERDAEIARLLGNQTPAEAMRDMLAAWDPLKEFLPSERIQCLDTPRYSTDPAACDRLVEEMRSRLDGVDVRTMSTKQGHKTIVMIHAGADSRIVAESDGWRASRVDAVSAAALLALRGER